VLISEQEKPPAMIAGDGLTEESPMSNLSIKRMVDDPNYEQLL
jgi:hypothetical protein